jgi:Ca2+-binding RTX toxin-like protein
LFTLQTVVLSAKATLVFIILAVVLGSTMNFNNANGASVNGSDPFANSANYNNPSGKEAPSKKIIPQDEGDDGDNIASSPNIIRGTNGDDFIRGTAKDDVIYGLKGDDQIYGFDGNDKIIGGKGNDIIDGGPDNDTIYGNTGDDFLAGNTGSDALIAGAGNDILRGRNALTSEAEPDMFNCGPGTDTIDDFNGGEGDIKTSDCEQ